jgi:hypothetical protein
MGVSERHNAMCSGDSRLNFLLSRSVVNSWLEARREYAQVWAQTSPGDQSRWKRKNRVPRRPVRRSSCDQGAIAAASARDVGPQSLLGKRLRLLAYLFYWPFTLCCFEPSRVDVVAASLLMLTFGFVGFMRQVVDKFKEIRRLPNEESILREGIDRINGSVLCSSRTDDGADRKLLA